MKMLFMLKSFIELMLPYRIVESCLPNC